MNLINFKSSPLHAYFMILAKKWFHMDQPAHTSTFAPPREIEREAETSAGLAHTLVDHSWCTLPKRCSNVSSFCPLGEILSLAEHVCLITQRRSPNHTVFAICLPLLFLVLFSPILPYLHVSLSCRCPITDLKGSSNRQNGGTEGHS